MLVVTQLIYVVEGREADFHAFEDAVLLLLARHNGELLLRLRPDRSAWIAGSLEAPYEVHVVRFGCTEDLERYSADEDRRRVLHLKQASVRETFVATANA